MARSSRINRRTWNDEKFRLLSQPQPSGQVVSPYLLTNPSVGPISGAYSAGEAVLADTSAWHLEASRDAVNEVIREGIVQADFNARLIWIPNAIRYNEPASLNAIHGTPQGFRFAEFMPERRFQ